MKMGSNPVDGKCLILTNSEFDQLLREAPDARPYLRRYGGTDELISGELRWCVWIRDEEADAAMRIPQLAKIADECRHYRLGGGRDARKAAKRPFAFCYSTYQEKRSIHIGSAIGNNYNFVPGMIRQPGFVSSHTAFTIYGRNPVEFPIIVSTLHRVWAEAVAGRLGNGVRYGNTVVYNTFPVPSLTDTNRIDLTRCGENILLAREAHFPANIADVYEPDTMPEDLHYAHEMNDETLERIYIGRRFRNDTERLEKLFSMYVEMSTSPTAETTTPKTRATRKSAASP